MHLPSPTIDPEAKMTQSARTRSRPSRRTPLPPQLEHVNLDAAGIDIGAEAHFVAVPPGRDPQGQDVRHFGAFTADLYVLADWLAACGVETVAMESTGVYWIPLFEVLEERGVEVKLVNPRHVKNVPGRKTDVLDCQWLQQLHTYGLLQAAFRPDDQICVLRSYLRQREMLVRYASHHIQHMQKALELMNLKLHHVVSDITGVTGMRILRAILEGERHPDKLAGLRDHRCKNDEATIALALEGHWRPEHLFALRQAVELFDFYRQQIAACDAQIENYLHTFQDRSGSQPLPKSTRRRNRQKNQPAFDVRSHLFRLSGVDLTAIEGIDAQTALKLIGEIGLDMSRWPTEKHFASWLALCPGSKISGGKRLSGRTKPYPNRAAAALRLAAHGLHNSHSALGAFLRRKKAHLGAPKAITATAHKLARLVYAMLKNGTQYVEMGEDEYERRYRERVIHNLKRKARAMGYDLFQRDVPALASAPQ
jgi:transposase